MEELPVAETGVVLAYDEPGMLSPELKKDIDYLAKTLELSPEELAYLRSHPDNITKLMDGHETIAALEAKIAGELTVENTQKEEWQRLQAEKALELPPVPEKEPGIIADTLDFTAIAAAAALMAQKEPFDTLLSPEAEAKSLPISDTTRDNETKTLEPHQEFAALLSGNPKFAAMLAEVKESFNGIETNDVKPEEAIVPSNNIVPLERSASRKIALGV